MTIQRAGAIGLAPLILNPATLAALAVGAVGYGLFRLLDDDEPETETKRIDHKSEPKPTVKAECSTVDNGSRESANPEQNGTEEAELMPVKKSEEPALAVPSDTQDLIRQAMSELGKKSAAARAKKKAALEAQEKPSYGSNSLVRPNPDMANAIK